MSFFFLHAVWNVHVDGRRCQGRIWWEFKRDLWWIGMSKSRPGPEFHKKPISCLKPLVARHRTRTPTIHLKPRPRFLVVPHSSSLPQHFIGLSSIIQVREDTYWLPILKPTINSQSIQVMHTHLINLTEGLSLVPWHQLQGCHFNQHRHHHDLSVNI